MYEAKNDKIWVGLLIMSMKILIVEDDKAIAGAMEYTLNKEGFLTVFADSAAKAAPYIGAKDIDLYLLDVMLPDGTGYDICRKIKHFYDAPVIFLTACDEEANVVMGLDIGADDYITKPFRVRELISRINSVLRRYKKWIPEKTSVFSCHGIRVVPAEAKVYRENEEVFLSVLEYKLLLYLIRNAGQVVTREQLLSHIFDIAGEYVNDNTLTVYIKRLREKLESNMRDPQFIRTVRGVGYMIESGE